MAQKRKSGKKLGARQLLARRKTLDYVKRLGLRKAARRLEAPVRDLRRWLDEGFPKEKIEAALGLGKPGGTYVYVKGSKLADLIKQRGSRSAATITGIPGKDLAALVKKNPRSAVKLRREALLKLTKKKGAEKTAEILGTKLRNVTRAKQPPLTEATLRLKKFVDTYGAEAASSFLGVTGRQLDGWLKKGIPRSWEADIGRIVGKRSIPTEEAVKAARPPVDKAVAEARKKALAWNKKVPGRFRIRLTDAERWAKLGNFNERFESAQRAYEASKNPGKPKKPKPAPPQAPPRPIIPPGALPPKPPAPPPEPPTKPPKPPKKPPDTPPPLDQEWRSNFLQARAEAFINGEYPKPPIPWNLVKRWALYSRNGIHTFRKVEKFVHELDLGKLGEVIIALCRKMWDLLHGKGELMSVRFTFSILGVGNPFYPEGFHEENRVTFPSRQPQVSTKEEIVREIMAIMEEIYYVDTNITPLFLEYYEVIKSVQNPKPEPPKES